MPYTPPTVNYSATNSGTYTSLTGVLSVSINRGRQRFQDPFPPSTCTVELIPATSYALPLAIGQFIDVRDTNSASSPCYFTGQITDVSRSYAIPYNSGTGYAPADRITITATGGVGKLGSATLDDFSVGTTADMSFISEYLPFSCGVRGYFDFCNIAVGGGPLSGAALPIYNQYLQTSQMFVDDVDDSRTYPETSIYTFLNKGDNSLGFSYSDTGTTRYKALQYQSSVQNTFNYVEVQPSGLASQVTSGTAPYNSLIYSTYNKTTSDASSLSGYLYGLLSGQLTPVPFTISTDTTIASSCMDVARIAVAYAAPYFFTRIPAIGQVASVTFRGTSVNGQIQGISSNFYPDHASVQLYFSPTFGVPFTLDSSVSGVLDTNRLGYP